MVVHVDDFLVALLTQLAIEEFFTVLSGYVTIEPKGRPRMLLGLELEWEETNVRISGESAIKKLANDLEITTIALSPYMSNLVDQISCTLEKPARYRALIGRLLFIARRWRPDIRYVVNRLCTKISKSTNADWRKGIQVVRYLASTAKEGIRIEPESMDEVEVCTDAGEENLEEKATTS